MADSNTMGGRIREARELAGLSQTEVANRIGVSRAAVSLWESDQTKQLAGLNLQRLASLLGRSAEWLATGQGPDTKGVPAAESPAFNAIINEETLARTIRLIESLLREMNYPRSHPIWTDKYRSELIAHAYRLAVRGRTNSQELRDKIRLLAQVA